MEEEVVVRLADRRRLPAHELRSQGVHDPPENRQRQRDEQQVVVEERRLTRDERLELRLRPKQRQPQKHEAQRLAGPEADETEEPRAERGLGERMYRLDDPASRQERSEEGQAERESEEQHVPPL